MRVRILFFGMLKDLAGKSSDLLELPEPASVADVLAHYQSHVPRFKDSLPSLAVAVNQQYAGPETKLRLDDEVALLPPVSGGSGKDANETAAAQPVAPRRYAAASILHAEIIREAIDTQQVLASLKRGEDGAAVVFEGVVRNQTRGRKTLYLDYEAYEEMALQQMEAAGPAVAEAVPDSRCGPGSPAGTAGDRRDQRAGGGGVRPSRRRV